MQFNRAIVLVNLRREPIYLPDFKASSFEEFHKFFFKAFAVEALPPSDSPA